YGERVSSLQHAFHMAGTRNVVTSQWDMDPEATVEIMTAFYQHLDVGGLGVAEALRQAQLAYLASNGRYPSESRGPHPFFWGGWVASGDTRPLMARKSSTPAASYASTSWVWGVGGAVMIGAAIGICAMAYGRRKHRS